MLERHCGISCMSVDWIQNDVIVVHMDIFHKLHKVNWHKSFIVQQKENIQFWKKRKACFLFSDSDFISCHSLPLHVSVKGARSFSWHFSFGVSLFFFLLFFLFDDLGLKETKPSISVLLCSNDDDDGTSEGYSRYPPKVTLALHAKWLLWKSLSDGRGRSPKIID